MEKIESYEQCNLLIKNFKKNNNKTITNFFFLPKELKALIASKEIFYQENKEALIFCIEEKDFSHIFYFVNEKSFFELENTEKIMIIDLIARKICVSKEIELEEKIWRSVGFKEYKQYIRLWYHLEKDFYEKIESDRHRDYQLTYAELMDRNAVLDIWETNLDKYSSPLPNDTDMEHLLKSGHIFVAKREGIVKGAVYMDVASKSCILKHLVVIPSCRRQGLSTALMNYALKAMVLEHIERCYLWVDINNTPAYENYKKYGFEEDGLWSKQLMR